MDIRKAREYEELGVLSGFSIARDGEYWTLVITASKGHVWTLHTARGSVKRYRTADAAIAEMERICGDVSELTLKEVKK